MPAQLNNSIVIHRLAGDLGLRSTESPVKAILSHCNRKVKGFLQEFQECATPAQLLDFLANKLGTVLIEGNSDADLGQVAKTYVGRGETIFATLNQELDHPESYGITLKLRNPATWEQPYVSIIDCRGKKRQRRYHTKWHELGHLLILTDQTRFAFRRTHDPSQPKSAEESLVDAIAGEFSFYPALVVPHARGQLSFNKIEKIRAELCPEASMYSAILNVTKLWPTPCVWIEAKLARKKSEENDGQHRFDFQEVAPAVLRAVHTSSNDPARELGMLVIPHFRVPKKSVIYKVFDQGLDYLEGEEDLGSWESSNGSRLDPCRVRVQAKRIGESIHALVVPCTTKVVAHQKDH